MRIHSWSLGTTRRHPPSPLPSPSIFCLLSSQLESRDNQETPPYLLCLLLPSSASSPLTAPQSSQCGQELGALRPTHAPNSHNLLFDLVSILKLQARHNPRTRLSLLSGPKTNLISPLVSCQAWQPQPLEETQTSIHWLPLWLPRVTSQPSQD